jgi:hypothetical protein
MPHTPGPWHRNIRKDGKYPTVYAGRNKHVASASAIYDDKGQFDGAEVEANIDLIAAAPDLLAACEAALSLLNNIGKGNWAQTPAGDALRAAIAKAKGE